MKKAVLILILSLLSSVLFGSEIYNSGTSNGGNDAFKVYGFYKPAEMEKVITLEIFRLSTNNDKVQNTGLIDWENANPGGYKRAFSWKATGNFSGIMTIRFTITPLQAELDGWYFIPAHSFQAKLNNGTGLSIVADQTDFVSSGGTVTANIAETNHDRIRSDDVYRITYSGSKTGSTNSAWTAGGLIDIKIIDYNALYGGTFDYYSTVTVELTVDVVSQGGN